MRNYLGYSNAEKLNDIELDKVKSMLNRDCPVIAMGHSRNNYGNAHTWVIDGIASQYCTITETTTDLVPNGKGGFREETTVYTHRASRDLYHCNFGWGGTSNGYYHSGIFDSEKGPVVDDDDNPSTAGGFYSVDHRVITYNL
jgi:hypothetical protein